MTEDSVSRRGFLGKTATAAGVALAGCSTSGDTGDSTLEQTANETLESEDSSQEGFETLEEAAEWVDQELREAGYSPREGKDSIVEVDEFGDEDVERHVRCNLRTEDLLGNAGLEYNNIDFAALDASGAPAIHRFTEDISPEMGHLFSTYHEAFQDFDAVHFSQDEGDYAGARFDIESQRTSWIIGMDAGTDEQLEPFGQLQEDGDVKEAQAMIAESVLNNHFSSTGLQSWGRDSRHYEDRVYVANGESGTLRLRDGEEVEFELVDGETAMVEGEEYDIFSGEDRNLLDEEHGLELSTTSPTPYSDGMVLEGVHEVERYDFSRSCEAPSHTVETGEGLTVNYGRSEDTIEPEAVFTDYAVVNTNGEPYKVEEGDMFGEDNQYLLEEALETGGKGEGIVEIDRVDACN